MHSRSVLAAILVLTSIAHAQEWTRFRGPNGSGIGQAKLPEQLTQNDLAWKIALPGSGHSSPVIWGDKLFVNCTPDGAGPSETARRIVACINTTDGKLLWQREF